MFADALPPPTYCADWYMAGWPASLIVPLALTASLITLFFFVARRNRPWRSSAVLVLCVGLFVAADYVVYKIGCNFQAPWRTPPLRPVDSFGNAEAAEPLTIELRLSKDEYRTSEPVNAEIILHNRGKEKLVIPLGDGSVFEFLMVGDHGNQYLTDYWQLWALPDCCDVKLAPLEGGERHAMAVSDIISLKRQTAIDPARQMRLIHPKEQFKVMAIQKVNGSHRKPGVYQGILMSSPVSIKRITRDDDDKGGLRKAEVPPAPPLEKGEEKKAETVEPLAIELRLAKDEYRTSEPVNAEIIFHNRGKEKLLIPLIDGPDARPFFDFVIIGDYLSQFLTNHGESWKDPEHRKIKFIPLAAGAVHKVMLKDITPLKCSNFGVFPTEQFKVAAIYRDSFYGHGQSEAGLWKGIAISPPVSIKRITWDHTIELPR